MTPYTIIAVVWIIFLITWIVSARNVKRDIGRGNWWRSWWFRIIAIGFIGGWISEYILKNNITYHHVWNVNNTGSWAWFGSILVILGIALAIWARFNLGRNWSSHPTVKVDHELVTSGPYKVIRHPIYSGIILAIFGSCFVSLNYIFILIILGGVFIARVSKEEKLMSSKFHDQYMNYKRKTWALIPFIY